MDDETKPMSTRELTLAVKELLDAEQARNSRQQRKRRRRVRQQRELMRANIDHLRNSIEVIKWCIVGITTVMALSLAILVAVVWQIGNEAERIKGEVQQIKAEAEKIVTEIGDEAERIREKIQNPLRTIGGAVGGQLDRKIGASLGLEKD
jgi:hypothetical protein